MLSNPIVSIFINFFQPCIENSTQAIRSGTTVSNDENANKLFYGEIDHLEVKAMMGGGERKVNSRRRRGVSRNIYLCLGICIRYV